MVIMQVNISLNKTKKAVLFTYNVIIICVQTI